MHKIDHATAAPGGLFTIGNPVGSVAATVVTDDWLNAVQTEIVNVIAAASIALNKPNNAQLLAAIQAIITASIPAATPDATETVKGKAEIATQAETNAGTDDARMVSPLKLRNGFANSLTANGYVKFPSWLGGIVLQWGTTASIANAATGTVTFPLTFPTGPFFGTFQSTSAGSGGAAATAYSATLTTTQMTILNTSGGAQVFRWFAIGN